MTANTSNVVKGLVVNCVFAFKYGAKILRAKGLSRSGSKSNSLLLASYSLLSMGGEGGSGGGNGAVNLWQ